MCLSASYEREGVTRARSGPPGETMETAETAAVSRQVKIILVGLLIGTFSLLSASAFRDCVDSVFQVAVPIGERALGQGGMLIAYRGCFFLIILALLVAATVCFI